MIQIAHFSPEHQQSIIDLVLGIQQNEFNIPLRWPTILIY